MNGTDRNADLKGLALGLKSEAVGLDKHCVDPAVFFKKI